MPKLNEELKIMEEEFGEHKIAIMAYHDLYGTDVGHRAMSLTEYIEKAELPEMDASKWAEYYDYLIGIKIKEHVQEHGECQFEAEL